MALQYKTEWKILALRCYFSSCVVDNQGESREKDMSEYSEDYGSCCICESQTDVRDIIQLDYKVESESGWGCVICGLSPEGTVAIVCDTCIEKCSDNIEENIRFLMAERERRIPAPPIEGRILHEHDLSHHPEFSLIKDRWKWNNS